MLQVALSVSKPRRSFVYAAVSTVGSVLGGVLERVRRMAPGEAEACLPRFEQLAHAGRQVGWGWADALESAAKVVSERSVVSR